MKNWEGKYGIACQQRLGALLGPACNSFALDPQAKLRGRNRSAEEGEQGEAKEAAVQRSKSCKMGSTSGKPLVLPPKPEKSSGQVWLYRKRGWRIAGKGILEAIEAHLASLFQDPCVIAGDQHRTLPDRTLPGMEILRFHPRVRFEPMTQCQPYCNGKCLLQRGSF